MGGDFGIEMVVFEWKPDGFGVLLGGFLEWKRWFSSGSVVKWEAGSNGKSTTIDVLREIFGSEMSEASVRELYE